MIEGKKVPDVVFKTRVRDESLGADSFKWQDINLMKYSKEKE